MTLVFPARSLRALRWIRRALFAASMLVLGYCGFVVSDSWLFQRREAHRLEQFLAQRPVAKTALSPAVAAAGRICGADAHVCSVETLDALSAPSPAADKDLIGRIEIERLGVSVIIIEGISGKILRRAVGHIPGTALPGQPGNVGISGHRDTFFRPLRNIVPDDIIIVTTLLGGFRYRVVSTKIVTPSDVAVLQPNGHEILTLVTCYPFYFVGAAPDRFIVRAERVI